MTETNTIAKPRLVGLVDTSGRPSPYPSVANVTGTYAWALPVAANSATNRQIGSGQYFDASGGDTYLFTVDTGGSSTTMRALWDQQTASGVVSQTSPVAWATTDEMRLFIIYQSATLTATGDATSVTLKGKTDGESFGVVAASDDIDEGDSWIA